MLETPGACASTQPGQIDPAIEFSFSDGSPLLMSNMSDTESRAERRKVSQERNHGRYRSECCL